jgi:type I restriction-modification system DNA methylase subunit
MILHGVHYQKFDIKQEDSLEHPQHFDLRGKKSLIRKFASKMTTEMILRIGKK